MDKLAFIGCIFFILVIEATSKKSYIGHKAIYDFLNNSDYVGADPPSAEKATEVKIGIYVNSMSFDTEAGTMILGMYLRSAWKDERLKPLLKDQTATRLRVNDKSAMEKIWRPDIFVRNSDRSDRVDGLVHEALMRINATGHVWYVNKIIYHLNCPQLITNRRTIYCPFMIESFGYTMDTLYFRWLDSPIDVDKGVQIHYHILQDLILHDCSQNYTAGAFPCLEVRFLMKLENKAMFYASGVYVVSVLVVFAAWLSFWLPSSERRVVLQLGSAILLAILYLIVAGWTKFAFNHRVSPGQAWLIFCICDVVIMLIVNFLLSVPKGSIMSKIDALCGKSSTSSTPPDLEHKQTRLTGIIESVFVLIIFPLAFIVAFLWFAVVSSALKY